MKYLTILLLFISAFTYSQNVRYDTIEYKIDSMFVSTTSLVGLDTSCEHCVQAYADAIRSEAVDMTLIVDNNRMVMEIEGFVMVTIYTIIRRKGSWYFVYDYMEGKPYEISIVVYNGIYYINRLDKDGFSTTYKSKRL